MKFTVKDVPQLPYRTQYAGLVFDTPGNSYNSDNLPCTDEDVALWYAAGFVDIEGLDPSKDPDSSRPVTITPDRAHQILGGLNHG